MREVTEVGGQILHSFPYHPEGNGIVESFHLYFKKALISSLRLSDTPIPLILADILSAYRATPHPTTGESPFYLLTGMDMLTPNMQGWAADYSEDFGKDRASLLQMLREQAFDDTARKAVIREQNKKSIPDLSDLQPGTLVLYWLHPTEYKRSIQTTIGTTKTKPLWSAPCRVIRKSTARDNTYVIRSLWRKDKPKAIPREELLVIRGTWTFEEAQQALRELMADLRIHQQSQQIESSSLTPSDTFSPNDLPRGIGTPSRFVKELMELSSTSSSHHDESPPSKEDQDEKSAKIARPHLKRPRTAYCITWSEFDAILPSCVNGVQDLEMKKSKDAFRVMNIRRQKQGEIERAKESGNEAG